MKKEDKNLTGGDEVFRTLAETATDAIITIDVHDTIRFVNRAAEKIFGFSAAEMVGEKLDMLMPKHLRKGHRDGIKPYMGTGVKRISWDADMTVGLNKSGEEVPLEISFGEFIENGTRYFTGIVRDITERMKAEAQIRDYEENLKDLVEERTRAYEKINEQLKKEITERKRMEEALAIRAETDTLTQTYNRSKFNEIIKRELERASRYGQKLSMIMIDIDQFKEKNDTHGHILGDYVLIAVARILKDNKRGPDYLIRWGGDEFMIIAPETDLESATALAERMRKAVEAFEFETVGPVTLSFGVTEFKTGDNGPDFIKRTDDALYKAKDRGRNCVEACA